MWADRQAGREGERQAGSHLDTETSKQTGAHIEASFRQPGEGEAPQVVQVPTKLRCVHPVSSSGQVALSGLLLAEAHEWRKMFDRWRGGIFFFFLVLWRNKWA